jgi:multicomponent Na+:H+ antiporter subunit B
VSMVVIEVVAPRLLAPALMVAVAILVKGYADVGDGFSAGVIVGVAIALRYIALGRERAERTLPVLARAPQLATAGLLIALAVGFFPIALGDPPFTHLPRPGEHVIEIGTLELITAVAFDVGLFVLVTSSMVVLVHQLSHLGEGNGS